MKQKYYIMPTVKFCYGTEKADSKTDAIRQFMKSIDEDVTRLMMADTIFSKTRPLRFYKPPMNGFEILMNCAVESLKSNPDKLYQINDAVTQMDSNDINLLMHLQSAYEHARANGTDMDALAAAYRDTAIKSLSISIDEHALPRIALVSKDWKEGGTTMLLSANIPFDIYGDGRILCLEKDIDDIRRALKEVNIHVRRI